MSNSPFVIYTSAGGSVDLFFVRDRFHGDRLMLHIDQNANINNGEGECSILINDNEVKDLIAMLNHYIEYRTGKPYVILAEPLIDPAVNISVNFLDLEKNRSEQNG
jgi:hypothetical protein